MPIYEFYCPECNVVFNFFSRSVNTEKRPLCPGCKKTTLDRRMSVFAAPRRGGDEEDAAHPDLDGDKLEKALGLLTKEAQHLDEEDPRQAADLMQRLTEATGMSLSPGMEEALRRMEAGEDIEKIDAEMGDILEGEEPFGPKEKPAGPRKRPPPRVDEKLYDL